MMLIKHEKSKSFRLLRDNDTPYITRMYSMLYSAFLHWKSPTTYVDWVCAIDVLRGYMYSLYRIMIGWQNLNLAAVLNLYTTAYNNTGPE